MRLNVNDQWSHVPTHGRALAFAGEANCVGDPLGAGVRDFNLMVVRDRWRGELHALTHGQQITIARPSTLVIHAPGTEGAPAVWQFQGEGGQLPAGWTALLRPSHASGEAGNTLQVLSGTLIVAQIQPQKI
jgi:environmental stress-induced protein Ves